MVSEFLLLSLSIFGFVTASAVLIFVVAYVILFILYYFGGSYR